MSKYARHQVKDAAAEQRRGREGVTMRDIRGNLSVGTIVGAAALVVVLAVALAVFPGRGGGAEPALASAAQPELQHTLADTSGASHVHDLSINAAWAERALRADEEDAIPVADLPV